ncbi:rna-directed dna polymerase from mobile element jockey- hypothetical protein [Limosa lapponica baueri]|uniref:Uncharacterized protein n=1 Tax=Limosa lapponica baueri TaxID=1758121 RepID=A0A2I0URV7_LIMLA|nr:rna-directed dna polymerase from mobile element jockey- hypothetical protein [Limosa lapponica baueri]
MTIHVILMLGNPDLDTVFQDIILGLDGAASPENQHIKDRKIMSSQHGFTKGTLYLTNLINFSDETTGLVNEGRAVDIVYLDFIKAFDTVLHKILIEKLLMYSLHEQSVRWIENWLDGPEGSNQQHKVYLEGSH